MLFAIPLFFLYIVQALIESYYYLFRPAACSFAVLATQEVQGTYVRSFNQYKSIASGTRYYTVSLSTVVVAAVMVINFLSFSFCHAEAQQIRAIGVAGPVPVEVVSNTNDSGAGSLRQVILNANASEGMSFAAIMTTGTLELDSELPTINEPINFGIGADNFIIDGSKLGEGSRGIHFTAGSDWSYLPTFTIQNFGSGVYIDNTSNINGLTGLTLTNNGEGFSVYDSSDITISNNTISNSTTTGINTWDVDDLVISDNTVTTQTVGISVDAEDETGGESTTVSITGNTVSDSNGSVDTGLGITAQAAADVLIQNNTIYDCDEEGIVTEGVVTMEVDQNEIYNSNDGIKARGDCTDCSYTNNSIYNTADSCLALHPTNDAITVTGNTLNNCASDAGDQTYGLVLGAPGSTVTGNTFTNIDSDLGAFILGSTATGTTIQGNYFGVTEAGVEGANGPYSVFFYGGGSGYTIGGSEASQANTFVGSPAAEFAMTAVTSSTISGNYFGVTDEGTVIGGTVGIIAQQSSNNTISGNTFRKFTGSAISMTNNADGNTIQDNTFNTGDIEAIHLISGSSGNTISGNTITNFEDGVEIDATQDSGDATEGNTVTQNTMTDISQDPIALEGGANDGVEAPVLTWSYFDEVGATVIGTASEAGTVEVYYDDDDEMETYVAQATVNEDLSWWWSNISVTEIPDGTAYTASFTDEDGNTSEIHVDGEAPTTSASISGGNYETAQTVTLSVADNTDPYAVRYYLIGGDGEGAGMSMAADVYQEYTEAITISEDTVLYYYSIDDDGNQEESHQEIYTIGAEAVEISDLQIKTIDEKSVDIVWITNVLADSTVYYGTDPDNLTNSKNDDSLVTNHTISLTELTQDVTYYIIVESTNGSTTDTVKSSFVISSEPATEDVEISNVKVSSIASTTATVTWTTNVAADSTVYYGKNKDKLTKNVHSSTLTTSHSIELSSLESGVTYYIRVESTDGSTTDTATSNFTTTVEPPEIVSPEDGAYYFTPYMTLEEEPISVELQNPDLTSGRNRVYVDDTQQTNTNGKKYVEIEEDGSATFDIPVEDNESLTNDGHKLTADAKSDQGVESEASEPVKFAMASKTTLETFVVEPDKNKRSATATNTTLISQPTFTSIAPGKKNATVEMWIRNSTYTSWTLEGEATIQNPGEDIINFKRKPYLSLPTGKNDVKFVAYDKDGEEYWESDPFSIVYYKPTPVVFVGAEENYQGSYKKPLLTGLAGSGWHVDVYIDDVLNGTFQAASDPSGTASFSYEPFLDLDLGEHSVVFRTYEANGKPTIDTSGTFTVTATTTTTPTPSTDDESPTEDGTPDEETPTEDPEKEKEEEEDEKEKEKDKKKEEEEEYTVLPIKEELVGETTEDDDGVVVYGNTDPNQEVTIDICTGERETEVVVTSDDEGVFQAELIKDEFPPGKTTIIATTKGGTQKIIGNFVKQAEQRTSRTFLLVLINLIAVWLISLLVNYFYNRNPSPPRLQKITLPRLSQMVAMGVVSAALAGLGGYAYFTQPQGEQVAFTSSLNLPDFSVTSVNNQEVKPGQELVFEAGDTITIRGIAPPGVYGSVTICDEVESYTFTVDDDGQWELVIPIEEVPNFQAVYSASLVDDDGEEVAPSTSIADIEIQDAQDPVLNWVIVCVIVLLIITTNKLEWDIFRRINFQRFEELPKAETVPSAPEEGRPAEQASLFHEAEPPDVNEPEVTDEDAGNEKEPEDPDKYTSVF